MLKRLLSRALGFPRNRFHPLVWINGDPVIGEGTTIGFFSEINAKGSSIFIGHSCDIASFVSINCADSHMRCLGLSKEITRRPIYIGQCVFIGSHCVVKGGAHIGRHTVIAAGTVVEPIEIPPYSLVRGNPMIVAEGHYLR